MHRTTGHDDGARMAAEIAEALARGRHAIVSGPEGSGKSHLVSAVVDRLRSGGEDPVVVTATRLLAPVPGGALRCCADSRAQRIAEGDALPESTVVVVDDAHQLDAESVVALATAVFGRRVRILLALSSRAAARPGRPGRDLAHELWMTGLADRWDLRELDDDAAEALLASLPEADAIDSISRARIIVAAAGSRRLLRELTTAAASAVGPVGDATILDPADDSRAANAADAAIDELSVAEIEALAFLGRVPRLAYADALRFVPPDVLDRLITRRLVADDHGSLRRLVAEPLHAARALRRSGAELIDAMVAGACTRMLRAEGRWWSDALASHTARAWHRGEETSPREADLDDALHLRILASAARGENDRGNPALALDHVSLAPGSATTPEIELEACRGLTLLRRPAEAVARLNAIELRSAAEATLLQVVEWWGALWMLGAHDFSVDVLEHRIMAAGRRSGEVEAVLHLLRAERCGLSMSWIEARDHAAAALAVAARPEVRIRAHLVEGLAAAQLSQAEESRRAFDRAERESAHLDPKGDPWLVAMSVCSEIMAAALTGIDVARLTDRLAAVRRRAVRLGDVSAMAVVGLCQGIVLTSVGLHAAAVIELTATARRASSLALSQWMPLLHYTLAPALARLGRTAEARAVLEDADPDMVERSAMFRYARTEAETYVRLAEGDEQGARDSMLAAVELRLADRRAHADSTRSGRIGVVAPDALSSRAPLDHDRGRSLLPVPGRRALDELTRREREIALLVDEGLTNRAIAERLFLSVRTVESHVYQARSKIDARSRRDLGRIVADELTRRRRAF